MYSEGIVYDDREIVQLSLVDEVDLFARPKGPVVKIKAYYEGSVTSTNIWFKLYDKDYYVIGRVNGANVTLVWYKPANEVIE